jgi:hypothetical protein
MTVQDAKAILTGGDDSVTQFFAAKALDGLYFMIGEEEKKIRADPVGTGSATLQKVFGAIK